VKRNRIGKIGLVVLLIVSVTTRTQAILGVGDIVFDPAVFGQAVEQVVRLEQQYAQMVQSYQMLRNQYEQLKWMAQRAPVNMAVRYRALASPWRNVTAKDTYGVTAGWVSGVNSGFQMAEGYLRAVEGLGTYGSAFNDLPADQQTRLKTAYGTVELTDGANLNGLDTLGRLRANAPATELAIQGLENDSLSSDPAMNTEVAVLNKINAANVITVRANRDTNQLLMALAEQRIIESKRIRDAEARAFNQHIQFRQEGKAILTAQAAGTSQAMLDWRMP
jgi:hypothetical protein